MELCEPVGVVISLVPSLPVVPCHRSSHCTMIHFQKTNWIPFPFQGSATACDPNRTKTAQVNDTKPRSQPNQHNLPQKIENKMQRRQIKWVFFAVLFAAGNYCPCDVYSRLSVCHCNENEKFYCAIAEPKVKKIVFASMNKVKVGLFFLLSHLVFDTARVLCWPLFGILATSMWNSFRFLSLVLIACTWTEKKKHSTRRIKKLLEKDKIMTESKCRKNTSEFSVDCWNKLRFQFVSYTKYLHWIIKFVWESIRWHANPCRLQLNYADKRKALLVHLNGNGNVM